MGVDNHYHPPNTSPSSIILIIYCVISILCSTYVCRCVMKSGANTSSSKLVLFLSVSTLIMTISKIPFVYPQFPKICLVSESIFWYSSLQIEIITFFLLRSTNFILVSMFDTASKSANLRLSKTNVYIISFLPLIPVVFPLASNGFTTNYNWCGVDRDSNMGKYWSILYFILSTIGDICSFYQIYIIFQNVNKLSSEFLKIFQQKILRGPVVYSGITLVVYILVDIIILTLIFHEDMESRMRFDYSSAIAILIVCCRYFLEYSLMFVRYTLGVGFALAFVKDRKQLEVRHIKNLITFC